MQELRGRDLFRWYCWWKNSGTTWEVWTPVNNGIFTISSADPRIFSIHSIVWEKTYSTNCHVWTSRISSYSWTYWGEPGMSPTQSKISEGAWVSCVFSCSWWETKICFFKVTEAQRKRIYLNRKNYVNHRRWLHFCKFEAGNFFISPSRLPKYPNTNSWNRKKLVLCL